MDNERFPIVDVNGNVTGCATRKECHSGSMLLHPVVHLHVVNERGDIFLQKRSMSKDIQPGKWDTAVGGHVDFGESVKIALFREAKEELGIDIKAPQYICSYCFQSSVEHELVNVFYIRTDDNFSPKLSQEEIDDARFWSIDEINQSIGKSVLTPNFEQEFKRIEQYLE